MASIDDSRTGMRNPSSIADIIVKGAIALVTAAFFIGAYLQFQVAFWLALIAALAVYITLIMLHALMRRSERVDDLVSQVNRLEGELARTKGPDAASPQRGPASRRSATVPRPPLDAAIRRDLPAPGALPEGSAKALPRGMEQPPFGGLSAAADQRASKRTGTEPAPDYWSFRPAKSQADSPSPPPLQSPLRAQRQSAAAPPPPPLSAPASLREPETDLDDVQGMIKRLADELSLGDAVPAPGVPAPDQNPELAMRASADALHSTADTMRAAMAKQKSPLGGLRQPPAGAPMPPPIAPGHTRLSAVAAAVAAGRLNVSLKSIYGLADHQAHHYEVVLSPCDETGAALSLGTHDPQLARTGLNPLIDVARLKRASQVSRSLADAGKKVLVLAAASAESLASERFLEEIVGAYRQRDALAGELLLSFGLGDVKAFDVTEWSALTDMRDLGFRFALEDITDVNYEFSALAAAGFTYAKIDAGKLLAGLAGPRGLTSAADVCRTLGSLGMTVIIDGIDDEAARSAVIECGVALGAGPLFGPPRVLIGDAHKGTGTAAA
jgi:cyclic-di-GMP phosphodiesterase TipF (flagellum assembly factor)